LEKAIGLLELQGDEDTAELPRIKKDVEYGMGEYCFSLNEISEAIYRLLDDEELKYDCVIKIINHVLEAYSCNEQPEAFLEREGRYLHEIFSGILTEG